MVSPLPEGTNLETIGRSRGNSTPTPTDFPKEEGLVAEGKRGGRGYNEPIRETGRRRRRTTVETVTLNVKGMTCGHCVMAVKKSLEAVEGVLSAEVTLAPPRAVVTYDPSRASIERLTGATGNEGYPSGVAGR
jgi:mercuric ion binding protein